MRINKPMFAHAGVLWANSVTHQQQTNYNNQPRLGWAHVQPMSCKDPPPPARHASGCEPTLRTALRGSPCASRLAPRAGIRQVDDDDAGPWQTAEYTRSWPLRLLWLCLFAQCPARAQRMWRLKVATTDGDDESGPIHSLNQGIGRQVGPRMRSSSGCACSYSSRPPERPAQVWVFDPNGGTPQERAAVDAARRSFSAGRHKQKHSGDMLLRIQFCGASKSADAQAAEAQAAETQAQARAHPGSKGNGAPVSVEDAKLEAHIRKAVEFYGQLQAEDGHFPGDYGGRWGVTPMRHLGQSSGCVHACACWRCGSMVNA